MKFIEIWANLTQLADTYYTHCVLSSLRGSYILSSSETYILLKKSQILLQKLFSVYIYLKKSQILFQKLFSVYIYLYLKKSQTLLQKLFQICISLSPVSDALLQVGTDPNEMVKAERPPLASVKKKFHWQDPTVNIIRDVTAGRLILYHYDPYVLKMCIFGLIPSVHDCGK